MAKNQGQTRGQRVDNAAASRAATALLDPDLRDDKRPTAEQIAKREPKTYRALARGYADGMIREEGEVFATRADKGLWMEEIKSGKQSARQRAVDDTRASMSDDPDLTTFSKEALEAKALDLGLTNAKGLSKEDIIQAIQSAHDEDRAR